jgi:hypothetical protein
LGLRPQDGNRNQALHNDEHRTPSRLDEFGGVLTPGVDYLTDPPALTPRMVWRWLRLPG